MPMINNNVSVIKKWLDQGGDLSHLLSNYDNKTSFNELADLLKDDKTGLEAISKHLDDLENNTFDGYITNPEDEPNIDYNSYTKPGIYKVYEDFNDEQYLRILITNVFEDGTVEQWLFDGVSTLSRQKFNGEWSKWGRVSVSQTELKAIINQLNDKVDKKDGMGLSEANFTNDLKTRLENNTFDGYITINDDLVIDYDQYTTPGMYKVYEDIGNKQYSKILIVNGSLYYNWVDQLLINGPSVEMRSKYEGIWSNWKTVSVSQTDFNKIKEIIYKDNNKTIVLNGDVALLKGIDIKGYTELNENIVKYPLSIDSISINGKKINNKSIEVDNLYSIDENIYDSLNCSFDKITNIQKVKHIYLPEEGIDGENNTDQRSWVYSGMNSTKEYNIFYINLQFSHIDGNEKPILSTEEYLDLDIYNVAKGYWKEGDTFRELKYTGIANTFGDRTFFFQADMPRLWFVSRQGKGYSNIKVDANNPNPKIPIELFFEKRLTQVDVTDKYSELWEYIKNNGAGQKVEIKDNHSHLLENEIQYGNLISNNNGESSSEEIEAIKMALDKKVDKVDGKGLSTNDFTNVLKNKLNGIHPNATAWPQYVRFEFENEYDKQIQSWEDKSIFNQFYSGFYYLEMYYALSSSGECDETALLLCKGYEDGGYIVNRLLITQNGEIYKNTEYPEDWGYEDSNVWYKISVSDYDVDQKINAAIGDIETSLENIIQKYGLGGDGV